MSIASNLSFIENLAGAITTGTINATQAPITFSIANSEGGRFSSSLNLLLGYTSDQGNYKLQVNGNALVSGVLYATTANITTIIGTVSKAASLAGGSGGQIPYQTSCGTSFSSGLTYFNNTLTVSGGFYSNQAFVQGTSASTSTNTGALVVAGGAGIAQNLYVGSNLIAGGVVTATNFYAGIWPVSTSSGAGGTAGAITSSTTSTLTILNFTPSTNTTTGALSVSGGVGIGGCINVGGNIFVNGINTYTGNAPVPQKPISVQYLIVAGGGSGGGSTAGGGGAGGLISSSTTLLSGATYNIVVGAGAPSVSNRTAGLQGVPSSAFGVTAVGGGGGSATASPPAYVALPGTTGGSGGGGTNYGNVGLPGLAGTPGQGYAGGNAPTAGCNAVEGGGGGAGGVGSLGGCRSVANAGNGGIGMSTTIITTSLALTLGVGQYVTATNGVYFAGGGGAGGGSVGISGFGGLGGGGSGTGVNAPGKAATGGGGGGGFGYACSVGGAGGSGVVIVSYTGTPLATGGTVATAIISNTLTTVHVFTSNGALQFYNSYIPTGVTINTSTGIGGSLYISGTATSVSTNSGALVVSGGVGISGNIYQCGLHVIQSTSTATLVTAGYPVNGAFGVTTGSGISYITMTPSSLQINGAFTFESWVYLTRSGRNIILGGSLGSPGVANYGFGFLDTTNSLSAGINPGWSFILSPTNGLGGNIAYGYGLGYPALNTWTHVAVSRDINNNWYFYQNGALGVTTNTNYVANPNSANQFPGLQGSSGTINITSMNMFNFDGAVTGGSTSTMSAGFNGYITGLRIVNGTALYTGASFTPPIAPPTSLTNTLLLLNAVTSSTAFVDQSGNYTLTPVNTVTYVSTLTPFVSIPGGSGALVVAGGASIGQNLIVGGSVNIITPAIGFPGGSLLFNGTSNYLSLPNFTPTLPTATTPFTVETWAYFNGFTGGEIASSVYGGSGNIPFAFGMGSSNGVAGATPWFGFYNGSAWATVVQSGISLSTGTWYHMAFVYTGAQANIYVNGSSVGAAAYNTWLTGAASTQGFYVGRRWDTSSQPYFNGYLTDFRFVKGVAVYNTSTTNPTFTPPVFPLTTSQVATTNISAISTQTILLLNVANTATYITDSSTATNAVTNVSTVTYSSFTPLIAPSTAIQSNSTNSGALVVSGGVGIGGNLYVGGTLSAGGIRSTTTSTAPANPVSGDIWYDSVTDDIYRYSVDGNGTGAWLDITGPYVTVIGASGYTAVTATQLSYVLQNGVLGLNATGPQSVFGLTNGVTLLSNTVYQFEIAYTMVKPAGTTSHTVNPSFNGTAILNNIGYTVYEGDVGGGVGTRTTTYGTTYINTTASTYAATGALTAAAQVNNILLKGVVSVATGGTFNPYYNLSAAPGGAYTIQTGSYMTIVPVGVAGANVAVGSWS